jgi:hypothetical protein
MDRRLDALDEMKRFTKIAQSDQYVEILRELTDDVE